SEPRTTIQIMVSSVVFMAGAQLADRRSANASSANGARTQKMKPMVIRMCVLLRPAYSISASEPTAPRMRIRRDPMRPNLRFPRLFALLFRRYRDRLLGPRSQRVRILQQVCGNLVVLHLVPLVAERQKWSHPTCLEIGPIGIVHLEVQRVIGEQREEQVTRVDPDAAEHAAGANPW